MIELDNIYNMDCLEGMKRIDDQSIDCVICDLPYEVLNKGNADVQWDRLIPMGQLWEQYKRITKPNAAIILFCQGMFTARLMMSQPKMWRYNLIWEKGRVTGFLNANRMPMRSHEDIAVFYRKQPTYHPQMRQGDSHAKGNGKHKHTNQCYGGFHEQRKEQEVNSNTVHPKSVLYFKKEHGKETFHPTQKPVELIRYLIRTYSNPGDVILDNTIGSGTTAIAAIRERRHWLGFELNKEYFDKAQERIAEELQNPTLSFDAPPP